MKLFLKGHDCEYAATQMLLTLLPEDKPALSDAPPAKGEDSAVSALFYGDELMTATCHLALQGKTAMAAAKARLPGADATNDDLVKLRQRIIKQSIYRAYTKLTGLEPPWGSLSGVRPSKLVTAHLSDGGTAKSADRLLKDVYRVTEKRRRLCVEAGQHTMAAKSGLIPDELSLYIGIPFCPTRCSYCSFVSQSIEKSAGLLPAFLDCLEKELDAVAAIVAGNGKKLRTIYVGGGTPTTLSASQLERLIKHVLSAFDLSRLSEFTVEAGRPDTIDENKLSTLKSLGVTRVSVNPQTMRDDVLALMGRNHTAAQTEKAMTLALSSGFEAVNADMIAGLPGDDLEGFCQSLDKVIAYGPENITVHTLSIKRGSTLNQLGGALPTGAEVEKMLDFAGNALSRAGYEPYYLYRQKYMSGSFENVGWTKPGHDNLYNIVMMEELHTVISCGGGAASKLILPDGKLIRQTNPKYPNEYIQGIDKVIFDKQQLFLKG